MPRSSARLFGTATIVVLLRGWLQLMVWSIAGAFLAGRLVLMGAEGPSA